MPEQDLIAIARDAIAHEHDGPLTAFVLISRAVRGDETAPELMLLSPDAMVNALYEELIARGMLKPDVSGQSTVTPSQRLNCSVCFRTIRVERVEGDRVVLDNLRAASDSSGRCAWCEQPESEHAEEQRCEALLLDG